MLQSELDQFTGTEHYYKYLCGTKLTDGVMHLANEAGCFWLLDIIASYQTTDLMKAEDFQVWTLKKCGEAWLVTCDDGNKNEITRQVIPYSDFPFDSQAVWCINGVMLLPSEY